MKTSFRKLVFVFAITSFIFSCNNNKKVLTDRENQGFKGNVQFIFEINSLYETLIEFNSDGTLKKELKTEIILEKPTSVMLAMI